MPEQFILDYFRMGRLPEDSPSFARRRNPGPAMDNHPGMLSDRVDRKEIEDAASFANRRVSAQALDSHPGCYGLKRLLTPLLRGMGGWEKSSRLSQNGDRVI